MNNLIKLSQLFFLLIVLSACKTLENKEATKKMQEDPLKEQVNKDKSQMEIRVSCGNGEISEFINDGWIIVQEYSEEKICSWKSFPATKDCDMEKDKGCKITTPDKIGEEKIYLLER